MKYSTIEVTYEDEELYNRITPKAENHCTMRSAQLSSTPTDTLLECSAIHESNAPTKMKDLQMRIIAREKRTYSRRHDASDDRLR